MSSISDLEVQALRKATGNMDPDATITDLRMEFYRGIIDGTINVGGPSVAEFNALEGRVTALETAAP